MAPTHAIPWGRPAIVIALSDSLATVGSTVTVTIDAQRPATDSAVGPALAAFRARLVFSSAQLQYVDEAPNNTGMHAVNVIADTARIVGIAPGTGFSNGQLVTLRFRVLDSQGLRSFHIMVDELRDLQYRDRRAEFLGTHSALKRSVADVVPPTSASRTYGDATADGGIDAADALAILTKDVGMAPPAGFDSTAADVNVDNAVNALDAQIVLASLVGRDVLQFRLGDVVGSLPVSVTSMSPDTLRPGISATITGVNFADVAASDTVLIDSLPVVVTAASATQLTVTVPSVGCRATHGALVMVRTGGSKGVMHQMLRTATPHTMQVGDTLVLDSDNTFRCNEFSPGLYFVAVYNTAREASPVRDTFQLVSTQATTVTGAPVTQDRLPENILKSLTPVRPAMPVRWDLIPGGTRARQHTVAHLQFMERDRLRAQHAKYGPSRQSNVGVRFRPRFNLNASLGAYSTVNFLGVTKDGFDTVVTIRARTVYVGTRAQILEDSLAPLAQQMDSYYQQLGTEFDNVMYPILTTNFGNPLAMDGNLSRVGRVTMLFTPSVAQYYPGTEAFVTVCDYLTLADCPASNLTEMFYADVPTRTSTLDGSDLATTHGRRRGGTTRFAGRSFTKPSTLRRWRRNSRAARTPYWKKVGSKKGPPKLHPSCMLAPFQRSHGKGMRDSTTPSVVSFISARDTRSPCTIISRGCTNMRPTRISSHLSIPDGTTERSMGAPGSSHDGPPTRTLRTKRRSSKGSSNKRR